jgi:hypothetical protein
VKADIILVIGFIAAVCGAVGAVLGVVNGRRAMKAAVLAGRQALVVQKISVEVDGRLSDFIAREAQLHAALTAAGVPIPEQPEKPLCGTGIKCGPVLS